MRPRAVVEADPDGTHAYQFSLHFSGLDRRMHDAGRCFQLPVNLGEIPDYSRRFINPVDIDRQAYEHQLIPSGVSF